MLDSNASLKLNLKLYRPHWCSSTVKSQFAGPKGCHDIAKQLTLAL